jgi:hypothetical protein
MLLYKYRDFASAEDAAFARFSEILTTGAFWCAGPSTLNDPTEFIWECDYSTTAETASLLQAMLVKLRGKDKDVALVMSQIAIRDELVASIAQPVFQEMIDKCRSEIGISCFATSDDNTVMWERYGGKGNGVCIAVELPDQFLGENVFPVSYFDKKIIHIDKLLSTFAELDDGRLIYEGALLSKPLFWKPEGEIRFVSMSQNVHARMPGSKIASVTLGANLSAENASKISALANELQLNVGLAGEA